MYELIQLTERTYYIKSPTNIGLFRLDEKNVCLIDSGNDKDAGRRIRQVLDANDVGYRSIDTAQAYGNEEGVGAALAESGLPREEFFLTTKVWITNAGYETAKASIEESMRKLRTDYLDLLLIHQPFGD